MAAHEAGIQVSGPRRHRLARVAKAALLARPRLRRLQNLLVKKRIPRRRCSLCAGEAGRRTSSSKWSTGVSGWETAGLGPAGLGRPSGGCGDSPTIVRCVLSVYGLAGFLSTACCAFVTVSGARNAEKLSAGAATMSTALSESSAQNIYRRGMRRRTLRSCSAGHRALHHRLCRPAQRRHQRELRGVVGELRHRRRGDQLAPVLHLVPARGPAQRSASHGC